MARPRKAYVQPLPATGKALAYRVRWTHDGREQSVRFDRSDHHHATSLCDALNDPHVRCKISDDDERVTTGTLYGRPVTVRPDKVRTVEQVALQAIDASNGNDDTRKRYRLDLYSPNTRQFLDRDVRTLTKLELVRWIRDMRDANGEPVTVAAAGNRQVVMRMTMKYALAEGYVLANPLHGVKRWAGEDVLEATRQRVLNGTLEEADVRAIVAQAEVPLYADLWQFMAWTGLRINEALGLQVKHVVLDDLLPHVEVRQQLTARGGDTKAPKTTASIGDVHLWPEPIALLRRLTEGRPADAWVFANPYADRRGRPCNANTVRGHWDKAVQAVGLPEGTHMHDLRHHAATFAISHGADVTDVQHMMRHASSRTTETIYVHRSSQGAANIVAAMSQWGATDEVAARRERASRTA